jgi:hypothetical protein
VQSKTKPVLAKAIETTPDALILTLEAGALSIPWEKCFERLVLASPTERNRVAVGPLVQGRFIGG